MYSNRRKRQNKIRQIHFRQKKKARGGDISITIPSEERMLKCLEENNIFYSSSKVLKNEKIVSNLKA